MRYTFFLLVLTSFLFSACQRKAIQQAEMLSEARAYHQQATAIQRSITPALTHLEQERNQINIQGRALSVSEQERVTTIEALLEQYASFEAQFSPPDPAAISRKVVAQHKASLETLQAIRDKIKAFGNY